MTRLPWSNPYYTTTREKGELQPSLYAVSDFADYTTTREKGELQPKSTNMEARLHYTTTREKGELQRD